MALIFKDMSAVVEVPGPVKQGFSWDAWYAKNKTRLSVKRAKRYREDSSYRAAALERSRLQRETKKPVPVSEESDLHSVSFTDAADAVGVTVWVLREWRRKNYFPEPHRKNGRLWFSVGQVQQLRTLQQFFEKQGARVTEATRPALENVISLIFANW